MSAFELSEDRSRIDVAQVLAWLQATYWGASMDRETLERAIANSLCVGAYQNGRQVGFARAVTDRATMAWLSDVMVDETAGGQGIGRAMASFLLEHPELSGLRRWGLATRDAHGVYAVLGFVPLEHPHHYMERLDPAYEAALSE